MFIDGTKSMPLPVSYGVPQGTELGPLLFLAYINGMPEGIQSTVKLFADDSLVYRKISNKRDFKELQQDLDRLCVKKSGKWLSMQRNKKFCASQTRKIQFDTTTSSMAKS